MPRILCARFPHLALVDACRRHAELRGEAVVITEPGAVPGPDGGGPATLTASAGVVVAASTAARAGGVRAGQPLRQARQVCPGAVLVPLDAAGLDRLRRRVLAALCAVVPSVELGDEEAYADLTGRHARHPDEGAWAAAVGRALVAALDTADASLGVARSRFVAWMAARDSAPRRVRRVPDGGEAAFIAPLPVGLLPADPEVLARLGALGIDCIGAVAAFAPADLQRQFGSMGLVIHRYARGEDEVPLTPATAPRTVAARLVMEGPVTDHEVLRRAARHVVGELDGRLAGRGLAAGSLELCLETEAGEVSVSRLPPLPVAATAELWPAVLGLLAAAAPQAPVTALRLEAGDLTTVTGRQADLWRRGDGARDEVTRTAARLCDRFGRTTVLRPRLRVDPGDLPERRFAWELAGGRARSVDEAPIHPPAPARART